jgi:hypothetical protein
VVFAIAGKVRDRVPRGTSREDPRRPGDDALSGCTIDPEKPKLMPRLMWKALMWFVLAPAAKKSS